MEDKGTRKLGASRTKLCLKLGNIPLEGKLSRIGMESESGLSQFSPAGNPIGYKKVDKVTGEEVQNDEILKGKKVGDSVVTFTDGELDAAYSRRQTEVSRVKVEDIGVIPDTYVKSLYLFKPENADIWNMVGGRMVQLKKQLRFIYVEGRQEREAVLQISNGAPMLYVKFFPSEVAEFVPIPAACDAELAGDVDALMTSLSTTPIPEVGEKRNVVIDELVGMKLMGKPIPSKPPVEAKVLKSKTAKELLKESLAVVKAQQGA